MTSPFTDPRDGKTYKTVTIGKQIWLAENLNYEAEGSKFYNDDPANGEKYGRLYDWETAMKVCPPGWHLPSHEEWQELVDFVGGNHIALEKLKATNGWKYDKNSTDEYGFSALPGGNGYSGGSFDDAGSIGYWWSSSEDGSDRAYNQYMGYDYDYCGAWYRSYLKNYLLSVRCVKDLFNGIISNLNSCDNLLTYLYITPI